MATVLSKARRTTLAALACGVGAALAALLAIRPAMAQEQPPFYELNPPLPTDSPGKVEVVEFFWYGCPHCYALEPALLAWVKKLPQDVVFKRVPAIFNENWAASARVFYTLEAMGELPRLHSAFFDAIHKDGLRPISDSQVLDWMKVHGVDVEQFKTTEKAFSTESRMKRARALIESAKIDGVPAIVIQGHYVVTAQESADAMLGRVDQFIGQARKALAPAGAAAAKPASAKAPAKG
jgi:thiol:disulfide interchange protein DsbA